MPSHLPPANGHVFALQGGIRVGLIHYCGSNEERQKVRIRLFSKSAALGQPSHFFTIIPNNAGT